MFRDRQDAAAQLAARLKGRVFHDPVVLGIPRGGVVLGAALARGLGADLDVVLSRKLRAPGNPELALGALGEDGTVYLDPASRDWREGLADYLEEERRVQGAELAARQARYRSARPAVAVVGRSVIVTDDGIATGSTMLAALAVLRAQRPHELIVAAPVCAPERAEAVRRSCDELVVLHQPRDFAAIGYFYGDFRQVEDAEVLELLRAFNPAEP